MAPEQPWRMRFPPAVDAPRQARHALREALAAAGVAGGSEEVADTALLLASELFDNAVLHAGTDFLVELNAGPEGVTVAVTDHGPGPLELHLAQPRQRFGRAATHGRGLLLLDRVASAWGSRHESDGSHTIWFTVRQDGAAAGKPEPVARWHPPSRPGAWPDAEQVRRLLVLPAGLVERLDAEGLVAELARRLREVGDLDTVVVEVDHGDGNGTRRLVQEGPDPDTPGTPATEVRLPLAAPLRGRLRIAARTGFRREVAELAAERIALAVESEWLRGADRRRRTWMTYLADTSQLLSQSLDAELTVTVIPQVVVPRLGQWCAVHLVDPSAGLRLGALTHADENRIPELRAALDPGPAGRLVDATRTQLVELVARGTAPAWIGWPTDGIAVPLIAGGRRIGVLTVGRLADRAHSPEDVALITDIARRSALAVDNAQRAAGHAAISQALQGALLPRALPTGPGVEFAAAYLPASTGSDVGGDFYDVMTLGRGRWLAAIGDVCGKGPRAAARTGQVRDVLRALARDGRPLVRALELLNDVMMEAQDPSQFCTLAAAEVRRRVAGGLDVDLVLAGHEQPVLVRADGRAEPVGVHGTALGLVERMQLTCTTHRLAPGDTLLTFTDGVTERRGDAGFYGSRRLLAVAGGAAAEPPAQLVAAVRASVEAFSRDQPRDDIALLAVRATAPHAP